MSLSSILNDPEPPVAGPSFVNHLQPRHLSSPAQPSSSSQPGVSRYQEPSSSASATGYANVDVLMDDDTPQYIPGASSRRMSESSDPEEQGNQDMAEEDDDEDNGEGEEEDEDIDEDGDDDGPEEQNADNPGEDGPDEEEDDEDDDDDSEGDDEASEDLEGEDDGDDIVITGANIVPTAEGSTSTIVKVEPGTAPVPIDGEATEAAVTVLKPKRKRRRAPSLDNMPAPPPPMKTIRLERYFVPEEETLEWNILDDARANGMISETVIDVVPEPDVFGQGMEVEGAAPVSSGTPAGVGATGGLFGVGGLDESPEAIAARLEAKYDRPKTKKSKRRIKEDEYDLKDDLIDDSELTIDAPTHMGRAKKEGFFVHSGELELVMDTPPAKTRTAPKKVKPVAPPRESLAAIVRRKRRQNRGRGQGSSDLPIMLDDDDDDGPVASSSKLAPADGGDSAMEDETMDPIPVDRSKYKFASTDPTLLPPFATFPRPVAIQLMKIHKASEDHKWLPEQRSKFPDKLRPDVKTLATIAMEHDVFGRKPESERLYQALPSVLPYNRFTLIKLMIKMSFQEYDNFLKECIQTGVSMIKQAGDEGMEEWQARREEQQAAYNDLLVQWDKEQKERDSTVIDVDAATSDRPQPTRKTTLWTNEMKEIFWQLVDITQEQFDVTQWAHVKGTLNILSIHAISDKVIRKELYDAITGQFPSDTGITNEFLSKEMSRYKLRTKTKEGRNGPTDGKPKENGHVKSGQASESRGEEGDE